MIDELLDNAKGFIDTTHQDRYDECESAVNEVLQRIRRIAPQWKVLQNFCLLLLSTFLTC